MILNTNTSFILSSYIHTLQFIHTDLLQHTKCICISITCTFAFPLSYLVDASYRPISTKCFNMLKYMLCDTISGKSVLAATYEFGAHAPREIHTKKRHKTQPICLLCFVAVSAGPDNIHKSSTFTSILNFYLVIF